MAKKSLLLVDADSQSLRMLEVSLRKAGFSVTTAVDAIDAWDKLRHALPDLIVADTKLPGPVSGFEFVADLKRVGDTSTIPVIFLASNATLAEKIIGLELGVDDYLTKPIYLKEVLTRVRVLLDKRDQQRLEGRERSTPPFSGLLGDMGLVDLVQTIELGRKTGRLVIHAGRDRGVIAFRDGRIVNARCGRLVGERAFYRMLVWSEGSFAMTFEAHREPEVIAHSTQMLLMEGVRRVDEWGRLAEQLPPVGHVFEIDFTAFGESLAQIPDEVNALLRHFDGRRSLLQVIDETELGDLEALEFASKLFFEGLIVDRTPVGEEPAAEPEPWPEEFNDGAAAAGGGLLVPHDTMPPGPAPAAASLPRLEDILAPPEGAAGAEVGAPARGDSPPPDLAAPTLALSPPMSSASPGQPSAGSPPPAARDHAALAMPVPLSLPASLSPQSMPPVPPLVATTPPLASAPSGSLSSPAALSSLPAVPRPLPATVVQAAEPRAVASRTSVNARTWSTTAVPQVSLADEGWEDVVAPIDELRLGRSSSVAAPAAGPPLLVSGPPTIVNTAPPVAADAPLSMPPAASFLPERARDDGALPPELAAPSHGFDDVDSDAARATPAQRWRVPAEAEEDIFDEPTDTGAGSPALAAAVAAVAPTMIAAAPTVIAATPSVVPVPSTAPGVEPSVHDARTAVEVPNDAVIDRFGHGRGAALLLIVGGFAVTLLATRAERSARDEAPSALAVVDAGPVVVDAGAVVVDAGAVVVDAGAVVVDAGSVEVDAATGAGGDEGKVDSRDAPPSPYDRELKRAEAFARRGDFGRAVRAYKAALAERSDGVTAHLGLGAAYYELDNLTAAMLHLERARVLDPQDPQVYVLLGAVYQSAGRRGDAIKAYEKFLKLAPGGKMATDVRAILRDL